MSNGKRISGLDAELDWLDAMLRFRFAAYGAAPDAAPHAPPLPPQHDARTDDPYARGVAGLDGEERLALILALAPHVAPEMLDPFLLQNQATGRRFTEFGGMLGQSHAGFLPSVETALFLIAGGDRAARIAARRLFEPSARLLASRLLMLDQRHADEPAGAALLRLGPDMLDRLLTGAPPAAPSGVHFPAERITSPLEWEDLILDEETAEHVAEISAWIAHARTLLEDWGLARRIKAGYRCLFHGPPGTGKTLTAALIGKHHGLPVYRIDLSRVVSKWIGETEKNLAGLFDQAQDRDWILFFDEADALFGKRTDANTANDRAANQQIGYLLQRVEAFPGLVILATNARAQLDEAFTRRFQSMIFFPMPDAAARQRLWHAMFAQRPFALHADVDLDALAQEHALAGGAILNVLRHACLRAVARDKDCVRKADIMSGIRQELRKEGRYAFS
ncbi:ATP-binding protein [Sphingomonas hengshuiensis]|uniref:AAA+ ATPase domain-containing protein n=1 Tax=Sphingomonas hengshuiensis TaxID=1609977 RepID=A0A7U4J8Y8_9SPHN|nr:ATP-binding protein [Sphingomonas hengshuiensis]AJP72398.1 hypothetical protein TS85_12285 [Sphingomonas hengshuiensis]